MQDELNSTHQDLQKADALFEKGKKLLSENRYEDSYEAFEQSAKLYNQYEKWDQYFECQLKKVFSLQSRNRLVEAERLSEDLLLHYAKVKGEPSILEYRLHSNLAIVFFSQKEHEKSKEYYQKGLLIAKKIKNYEAVAHSYTGLGNVCMHMLKYHESLSYYFKAIKIEKTHGYQKRDNHKINFLNIAYSYFLLHQFDLAKNYFRKALKLFEEGNRYGYYYTSTIKSVLGKIAYEEGNYNQSATYYQQALEIKEEYAVKDTDYAILLFRRGLLHIKKGDWEKGEADFRAAIDLQHTFDFKNYEWFYFAYMRLSKLYMDDKQWDKALYYLEEAKKTNQNLSLTKNHGEADIHFHFALLFEKQGKLEKALQYTQKAAKYWNKGFRLHKIKEKKLLFQIKALQIKLYRKLFDEQKKERYLYTANQLLSGIYVLVEEIGNKVFQEKDQIHFNQEAGEMYHHALHLLDEQYLLTDEEETLEEIFVLFEKSKVNSLLASFQNAEALQLTDIPNDKLQQLQALQSNIVAIEKRLKSTLKNNAADLQNEAAQELVELQIEYHEFIQKLEEEYPNYLHTKRQLPSIDLEELQDLLKPQTAIVEYEITQDALYIFALTSEESIFKRQTLPSNFDRQLDVFIDSGILGLNRKKYVQSAHQLYQLLIEPIALFLQQNAVQHLYFVPDIHLLELPFEALLTAPTHYKTHYTDLPYLLQSYSIQYHYSATLWVYQQKRTETTLQHQEEFLGFAPVYGNGQIEDLPTAMEATRAVNIGGVDYQALLYSEKEVQDIHSSFAALGKTGQIHLRTDANLTTFKKNLQQVSAKYLHIAAHSVLSEEEEELVGILFSPIQGFEEELKLELEETETPSKFIKRTASEADTTDMVLYPNEVAQLQLQSDLVFLSCCKSGVGKLVEGEGMLSINRSFLSAGVSNIVFTLFKIYDSKTPLLTQHFYEAVLKDGKSYSEALQFAKQQMIQLGIAPKFWSGFLLLGI